MLKRLTLALSLLAGIATAEPKLTFSGRVTISNDIEVGGLSGIELSANGTSGMMISDNGSVIKIYLEREDNNLKTLTAWYLPSTPRLNGDLEGIASLDNETFAFSLEGPARVVILSPDDSITTLPNHPRFWGFEDNSALEALAIRADGTLFTMPESATKKANVFPLFAYENNAWTIVAGLPKRDAFQMVGADFGPDGLFYTLERAVSPLGFRARVRRFDLNNPTLAEQTLLTTRPARHDNLEGISVWMDGAGQTRVTMVSDDNFLSVLRNEIVEYILTE